MYEVFDINNMPKSMRIKYDDYEKNKNIIAVIGKQRMLEMKK